MSIVCTISRSSNRVPPCEGCEERSFKCEYPSGYKPTYTRYVRTFASADDLLAWVKAENVSIVLGTVFDTLVSLDGGPVPEWDVEIYDDYRE